MTPAVILGMVLRVLPEVFCLSDPFADIRPYRDEEVLPVLQRLLKNPDFLRAIASLRFERATNLVPWLIKPLVRCFLKWELRDVRDIHTMQTVIKRYMDRMIAASSGSFTVSGLEALDPGQAYLFMSNHRDIAMDPAFTNYALYKMFNSLYAVYSTNSMSPGFQV